MSVELYRESPGKFDSRTLSRKTLNRWTWRMGMNITAQIDPCIVYSGLFMMSMLSIIRVVADHERSIMPISNNSIYSGRRRADHGLGAHEAGGLEDVLVQPHQFLQFWLLLFLLYFY